MSLHRRWWLAAYLTLLLGTLAPSGRAWAATPAAATARPAAPTTAPALSSSPSVGVLRRLALAENVLESISALRQLSVAGDAGRELLRQLVPQLLARDAVTLEADAAVPVDSTVAQAVEKEIEPLRTAAVEVIAKMTEDAESLKVVHRNYTRLAGVQARLTAAYARPARVASALARRAECLRCQRLWDAAPTAAAEGDRFEQHAEQLLGMPAEAAMDYLAGPLDRPAEPARQGLWFFLVCRRIEAYNKTIEPAIHSGEAAHARRLNAYREMLGLLPYELDLRLTQSARRHSKEMIDLWYFSHWSPTESERSPFDRMARAGYAEGSNENIHMGQSTGDGSFWSLFDSPDHHRAWIEPAGTALGVGKWATAWTEDFGSAPRLMTATAAVRERAQILGVPLNPESAGGPRVKLRDPADIKFYDAAGHQLSTPGHPTSPVASDPVVGQPDAPRIELHDPKGKAAIHWQVARPATSHD